MTLRAADLFCGAGGTTAGAEASGAAKVVFAVNHWDVAIKTHSANFPHTKHVHSRLDLVSPGDCPKINLLFASPECTHHSIARGDRPMLDQKRAGAWDVMKWIEYHRPARVILENVREFESWGPLNDKGRPLKSKKGAFFDAWLMAIRAAGYRVEYALLNAADFGAATSRTRLFVCAWKGNRTPLLPEPTHTRDARGMLPGMARRPWRPAAEIIDWSLPCPSIFSRKRPLKEKTIARIERGLRKFVGPYVVKLRNNGFATDVGSPIDTITASGKHHGLAMPFTLQWDQHSGSGCLRQITEPLGTFVTKANTGVAIPYMLDVAHGDGGQDRDRTYPTTEPLGTATSKRTQALAVPFMVPHFGERDGQQPRTHDVAAPLPTATGQGAGSLVVPFLTHYYGTHNVSPITDPLDTITTKERHGLAMVRLIVTMQELGIADIGFRMLTNAELSLAQGFRPDYVFHGIKSDVTRQIGNSVSPAVAAALTLAAV